MNNKIGIMLVILLGVCAMAATREKSSSQSVEIKAPAARVWAILVDADHWAEDNPAVKKSRLVSGNGGEVGSVIEFYPVIGKLPPMKVKLKLAVSEKNRKLEFTAKKLGVNAVMGFELKEKNGVTTLTNYERAKGFMTRSISQEAMDEEHRLWVEAVKKIAER